MTFAPDIPADYLHDESRKIGTAMGIAFPKSTADVQAAILAAAGQPITVQGARTGISGGAVPDGGVIISLARMTKILSSVQVTPDRGPTITVQSGVLLSDLRNFLKNLQHSTSHNLQSGATTSTRALSHFRTRELLPSQTTPLIFPPDPTEISASIGGMAACNASGACSFAYGATRKHISGITLVLANGESLTLTRGQNLAKGREFSLITEQGSEISGTLPLYTTPKIKSTAGYHIQPGMDMLDLFIGSEGTLGIITEITLTLTPAPEAVTGIICFFNDESQSLDFVSALRTQSAGMTEQLTAIEYFDGGALSLIQSSAPKTGLLLPPGQARWREAIYIEWAHSQTSPGSHLTLVAQLMHRYGSTAADTWLAADGPGLKKMKAFRHAVPEQVNSIIAERKQRHPALTKLGTDLSVPNSRLHDVMNLYHTGLDAAALEYVIFGHIGDNHVHVNIMPRNMEEYAKGKALYNGWAKQVIEWGGSVSGEHGIGRLKKELLALMYGEEQIQSMRDLKKIFDPTCTLNPNRLFETTS